VLYRSSRLLALAALLAAPAAVAAPPSKQPAQHGRTAKLEPPARRGAPGRSIGSPTEGQLIGGAHLDEGPHLRIVPAYVAGDARWGLEPLVGMIDKAARAVRKQFPDAVLSVGHLSRRGGGDIDRHASHESGRDADIAFYVRNQQGKPIFADHFVPFRADGTAPTWPGAQFDDAKNWALIAAMVQSTQVRITHIFVATPLRQRLLQYAQKIGAPYAVRVRASQLMAQPRGSLPHDDHFHVRIGCPSGMAKCIEQPVARKRRPSSGKSAVANAQPSAPQGRARASSRPSSAPAPTKHAPPKTPPPQRPEPRSDESEATRSESLIPSLAPMVQGLDSVVIPKPIAGARPDRPVDPPPSDARIDDPDGVLDHRR